MQIDQWMSPNSPYVTTATGTQSKPASDDPHLFGFVLSTANQKFAEKRIAPIKIQTTPSSSAYEFILVDKHSRHGDEIEILQTKKKKEAFQTVWFQRKNSKQIQTTAKAIRKEKHTTSP